MRKLAWMIFTLYMFAAALVVWRWPLARKICDRQCNAAQCACTETCPKERAQ